MEGSRSDFFSVLRTRLPSFKEQNERVGDNGERIAKHIRAGRRILERADFIATNDLGDTSLATTRDTCRKSLVPN